MAVPRISTAGGDTQQAREKGGRGVRRARAIQRGRVAPVAKSHRDRACNETHRHNKESLQDDPAARLKGSGVARRLRNECAAEGTVSRGNHLWKC